MKPGNHNARKGKANRAVNLNMRCERDELDGWKQAAQNRGLTLADYVRQQMSAQARKRKGEK
jgi:hypothetical protein